jgi:hypothetical protein
MKVAHSLVVIDGGSRLGEQLGLVIIPFFYRSDVRVTLHSEFP